ncbi:MAG: formate dehydrogenase accessory sulfurtransferase FdhD [Methylococcaceae bacterium]|nr:formate dehydrogenase accessory sulfurtransferase FdhD [Methylococcaceae bacterium]
MLELAPELGWPAYRVRPVQRWRGLESEEIDDCVAEEAPVALMYNGEAHVVMLATPLDLEDFALGFSLTENIVADAGEVSAIRIYERTEGIEVRVAIPPARCESAEDRGRNLTGRTGCGLCGARTLQQAIRRPLPVSSRVAVPAAALVKALGDIRTRQRLNSLTGAVHAAAWVVPGDESLLVREDVGRHNALDKLIGALARKRADFGSGFAVVTSRASFEMVQKCAMVGIGCMAAISAPTGLAIKLAEDTGVTLIGFARKDDHVVYANPERLVHA